MYPIGIVSQPSNLTFVFGQVAIIPITAVEPGVGIVVAAATGVVWNTIPNLPYGAAVTREHFKKLLLPGNDETEQSKIK